MDDHLQHIGNEFVLACDMRFASRQNALFGNPEVGVGLVPLEWLPRVVGRSRPLEIALSGDDFDADIAQRYGWVNRTLDDHDLDSFVDALARRVASFDREALGGVKAWPGQAPCQGPQYRLRWSERLRIELRQAPARTRAGGRWWRGYAARIESLGLSFLLATHATLKRCCGTDPGFRKSPDLKPATRKSANSYLTGRYAEASNGGLGSVWAFASALRRQNGTQMETSAHRPARIQRNPAAPQTAI